MKRTRAGRRSTPLPWIATAIAPLAVIVLGVVSSRTHGFVSGMLLGICIVLVVASVVVGVLVGAGSARVSPLLADDAELARRADRASAADLAVLDALEPLRADRYRDHR